MTMHIVLDTNAIVSEGFGNSRQFKALLSVSNSLGYTIVVPANCHRRDSSKILKKLGERSRIRSE